MNPTPSWFTRFAKWTAHMTGRPVAFALAFAVVAVWAFMGPFLDFSDRWQLFINTVTTTITFLMVFIIQNTQNRDTGALHIKIDELIRALEGAHNALLDLEELDEKDLNRIRQSYEKLAREAREGLRRGDDDIHSPAVDREAT